MLQFPDAPLAVEPKIPLIAEETENSTMCLNSECPVSVPPSARFCPVCGSDNGCPNVRQAKEEVPSLRERLKKAQLNADRRGCLPRFQDLLERLKSSVAVIATSPNKAHALLSDPSETYTTFYRVVASGSRTPRSNWFDQVRGIADELLFPNYREYISFGALSLDGVGCWHYGSVHLVLADFAIRDRATVFEENSLLFCYKNRLGVHQPIPLGYRAQWQHRHELAACKLGPLVDQATATEDFPGILLSRSTEAEADFVEVHIYERLNRHSIDRVLVRRYHEKDLGQPDDIEDDEIMNMRILRLCQRLGLPCEEVE